MTEYLKTKWQSLRPWHRIAAFGLVLLALLCSIGDLAVSQDVEEAAPAPMRLSFREMFDVDLTDPMEADADEDGDGLTAAEEADLGTDPFAADTDRDGWMDGHDVDPVSRAVIYWGDRKFTRETENDYPRPVWAKQAFALRGEWKESGLGWERSADGEFSGLCLELNRAQVGGDLVLMVEVFDSSEGSLHVDLYGVNGSIVADDLFGNLLTATDEPMRKRRIVPLGEHPRAVGILLRTEGEGAAIYETDLVIDRDEDGFDAGQERQLGTSDRIPNGRRARASQWSEKRLPKPEKPRPDRRRSIPLSWIGFPGAMGALSLGGGGTDSDGDGMPDSWETAHGLNPTSGVLNSLIGWWKFDEGSGTTLTNSATNAYHGIAMNISTSDWVTGKFGGALAFDGTNNYVTVPQSTPMISGTQFTVTAWAQLDGASSNHYATLIADSDPAFCDGLWLGYDNDFIPGHMNGWVLACATNGTVLDIDDADADFHDQWVHFALTYNGDTARIYADGVEIDAAVAAFSPAGMSAFEIGRWLSPAGSNLWQGTIDDVRVYTSVLYSNQVHQLIDAFHDPDRDGLVNREEYENGTDPHDPDTDGDHYPDGREIERGFDPSDPLDHPDLTDGLINWWTLDEGDGIAWDSSTNNVYAHPKFGVQWNTPPEKTGILLDGYDDVFRSVGNPHPESDALTISCWILPHRLTGSKHMFIGYKYQYGWAFYIHRVYGRLYFNVGENGAWHGVSAQPTPTISPHLWTHVAVSFAQGLVSFYQNGALVSQTAKDYHLGEDWGRQYIGNAGYIAGFDGEMHDLRVYDWALTEELLTDLVNADPDGDGLSNRDEHDIHGTNPNGTDSDGDTLPDGWEVTHQLDPLSSDGANGATGDGDSDGLNNAAEYGAGTNPNEADSDDDGLTDADELQIFFTDPLLLDTDGDNLSDGDEVTVYDTDPLLGDTDGDGLDDGDEVQIHGTRPRFVDSDFDGIRDGDEVQIFGSNPLETDSDADGLPDGDERDVYQTEPAAWDTDGDGLPDSEVRGVYSAYPTPDSYMWEDITLTGTQITEWNGVGDDVFYQLTGNDLSGFSFEFFGQTVSSLYISDNGMLHFGHYSRAPFNKAIPELGFPHSFLAAFWDDLALSAIAPISEVFYHLDGTGNSQRLIVSWNSMAHHYDADARYTFQVILDESDHSMTVQFDSMIDGASDYADGSSATIGIEDASGKAGSQYSFNESVVSDQMSLRFDYFTTNPNLSDSDADGLSDGEEIHIYFTDPNEQDTDLDGFLDGEEVLHGSDPRDDQSILVSVSGELSYAGLQGGDFVVSLLDGDFEVSATFAANQFALNQVPSDRVYALRAYRDANGNGKQEPWEPEGDYGSTVTPITALSDRGFALNDPDSDVDGLFDWWEVTHFGDTHANASDDSDSDGLTNAEEFDEGTNPTNPTSADSDGDGVSDGEEYAAGTSGLQSQEFPVQLSGVVTYLGGLSHPIRVIASNSWSGEVQATLPHPGTYRLPSLVAGTAYWLKAYLDIDGDGVHDAAEPFGEYGRLVLTTDRADVRMAISDSDGNGLSDSWEATNTVSDPDADPDADGYVNLWEMLMGSDPNTPWISEQFGEIGLDVFEPGKE